MKNTWQQRVEAWRERFNIRTRSGVSEKAVADADGVIGPLPRPLRNLLAITNGLEGEVFRVLPLFDERDPKSTWDSLERANTAAGTRFFDGDEETLSQFIVFADIGGGRCAAYGREDEAIWFESDEDICQTDFELADFIEASLSGE